MKKLWKTPAVRSEQLDTSEIDALSPEQLTLWLARHGHSPEDVRRGLERALAQVRVVAAQGSLR